MVISSLRIINKLLVIFGSALATKIIEALDPSDKGFSFSALSAPDSAKQLPAKPGTIVANLATQFACCAAGLTFVPGLSQSAPEYT